MKIVHGFISMARCASNKPGVIAPFGELSNHSRTFSKEQAEYSNNNIPGFKLITFKSTDSLTGLETELPETLTNEILSVANAIVNYASTHTRPLDSNDFRGSIAANQLLFISDFELGPIATGGNLELPEFALWKSKANEYSEVRVWFSDSAFSNQYLGFDITVIPPIPLLSDFFLPFEESKAVVESQSMAVFGEKIQAAKARYPETVVKLLEFDLVNKYDTRVKIKTIWGVLIYGNEGDYTDCIKDAIVDYVLANSSYTQEHWELYFPDIFKRTEMIVVPRWDLLAVENLSDRSSLYSSVSPVNGSLSFLKNFLDFYDGAHIDSNSYFVPYSFKTIGLCIVNGLRNSSGKKDFKKLYSDYLPIPSTSLDFARMKLPTQNFILFLDDLLLWAEKTDPLSPLPTGLHRVTRNKKLFISSNHDGVNYLVAAKFNKEFKKL